MGVLKPLYPVKSNCPLELNRDNPFEWIYSQGQGKTFAFGSDAFVTFKNTSGQTLDSWEADVVDGNLHFYTGAARANNIPNGTSWTLTVDLNDGNEPRLFMQGTVFRAEAPFPTIPSSTPQAQPLQFSYSFGTPGFVVDPAWRIITGNPQVYDDSSLTQPNAVAAGSVDGSTYPQVSMLYYSPLNTDAVRLTYNVVRGVGGIAGAIGGETWVVISSSYDMSNSAAIYHKQFLGSGDTVGIATGSGVAAFTTRNSVSHTTSTVENFTAEYNASSNIYSVYLGTNTTPMVSWTDSGSIVHHGPGERYVGLSLKSSHAGPGVKISDWFSADKI
jgi:hypothetical protein